MEDMIKDFKKIQKSYKDKINLTNNFNPKHLELVAGIDLSYFTINGQEKAVCSIVVVNYNTLEVVEEVNILREVEVPYISGYLAFRELPIILEATSLLTCFVDLYMFDGNGFLHQENMGIATMAAIVLGKPTIGVAKSYFNIENATHEEVGNEKNSVSYIEKDNVVLGAVLRTTVDVKPIYVSCGNYIDLDTALEITKHLVVDGSKLPITTRYADLNTHTYRTKFKEELLIGAN